MQEKGCTCNSSLRLNNIQMPVHRSIDPRSSKLIRPIVELKSNIKGLVA